MKEKNYFSEKGKTKNGFPQNDQIAEITKLLGIRDTFFSNFVLDKFSEHLPMACTGRRIVLPWSNFFLEVLMWGHEVWFGQSLVWFGQISI